MISLKYHYHPALLCIGLSAVWTLLACCVVPPAASAQDAAKSTVLVEGLNNPTGIAIQPETGDVFVAESGARRIVRIVEGKAQTVIEGFPLDSYGKGPIFDIGPLSLLFVDKDTLVVGGGGNPDGEDLLRVFKIPEPASGAIDASATHGQPLALPAVDDQPGEGNFFALAKGSSGVFLTCNGDDKKGWVSRATLNEQNQLSGLERAIATVEAVQRTAPVALTISPEGHLVVGQMGPIEDQADSLLTFYSEQGEMLDVFPLGINDVSGLAYGPNHGRLFATDFHWAKPADGGLYKVVATKDKAGCKCVPLASLDSPTSLAFAPTGELYVSLAGNPANATSGKPDGKILLFKGLDVDNSK